MPSTKDPANLTVGPGLAAEDSVPEAALLFSTSPSVGSGSGGGSLAAHLADPVDAHDASAISLNPTSGAYDSANVQQALDELGYVAPAVNELGVAATAVPNSGVPTWTLTGRQTGGFRNPSGGDYGGIGAGGLVETFNIIPSGTDLVVTGILYPADRGVFGLLRIDPDGTEVDIGVKVDLTAAFTEATRDTGQSDYTDLNPGQYDLQLEYRLPAKTDYTANPGAPYAVYATDWSQYQLAYFTITLYDGWGSYSTPAHYRLLHTEDGEPFNSGATQYGLAVPTPGSTPLDPENVLMRERVFESSATAPAFSGGEPTLTATTPGAPANRIQSSGVYAFGPGDTFDVTAEGTAANDCFDTGADVAGDVTLAGRDPLELTFTGFGIADVGFAFDETDEGHTAAAAPDVADTFTTPVTTTVTVGSGSTNSSGDADRDAQFTATLNRPGVSSVALGHVTTADTVMVSAFSPILSASANKEELFGRDEPYRYAQDVDLGSSAVIVASSGGYDSTKLIDAAADVDNALQVAFGALIYPQTDYTLGHQPATGQPNYSAFAAEAAGTARYYQRIFETPSYSRRGTIEIDGISFSDFARATGEVYDSSFWDTLLSGGTLSASHLASRSGQVLVLLRIPGNSGWMDLGAPYGDGDLNLNRDGRGCLTQDLGGGVYEYDLGWSPSASADATPLPHLAVRVYMIMDAGAVVLTKEINRIAFT